MVDFAYHGPLAPDVKALWLLKIEMDLLASMATQTSMTLMGQMAAYV